jgi:hypothetical protein
MLIIVVIVVFMVQLLHDVHAYLRRETAHNCRISTGPHSFLACSSILPVQTHSATGSVFNAIIIRHANL